MVLRYKDIHAFDNSKTMKIIYSMYRAGEVSVHRACCERATQHYSLGGGGTICQDQQVFMFENRNRVFTHSLDVTGPDSSVGRVSAPENGRSWVRSRAAIYQSRKKWY